MVRRYGAEPARLKQALHARSIFIVSPGFNFVSEDHRQAFEIIKEPGAVLYRLGLKTQEGQ